jgi:hypothetical protein
MDVLTRQNAAALGGYTIALPCLVVNAFLWIFLVWGYLGIAPWKLKLERKAKNSTADAAIVLNSTSDLPARTIKNKRLHVLHFVCTSLGLVTTLADVLIRVVAFDQNDPKSVLQCAIGGYAYIGAYAFFKGFAFVFYASKVSIIVSEMYSEKFVKNFRASMVVATILFFLLIVGAITFTSTQVTTPMCQVLINVKYPAASRILLPLYTAMEFIANFILLWFFVRRLCLLEHKSIMIVEVVNMNVRVGSVTMGLSTVTMALSSYFTVIGGPLAILLLSLTSLDCILMLTYQVFSMKNTWEIPCASRSGSKDQVAAEALSYKGDYEDTLTELIPPPPEPSARENSKSNNKRSNTIFSNSARWKI